MADAVLEFLAALRAAVERRALAKLTLGAPQDGEATLRNVFVRFLELRGEPRLTFVFRHKTREVTKNFELEEGLDSIRLMLGRDFASAHLFTAEEELELQWRANGSPRLGRRRCTRKLPDPGAHDRVKTRLIDPASPWLQALGLTTAEGRVRDSKAAKFRQVHRFVEILGHCLRDAGLARPDTATDRAPAGASRRFRLSDMGCGKGYLTFAAHDWLRRAGWEAEVRGIEARSELVAAGNDAANRSRCHGLHFEVGTIAETAVGPLEALVALHACDTATDDAIAKGVQAGATLILVAPCCHKEIRPQLEPPAVLAGALRHGILLERQAEFVTDALRAALLEWAGYETKVFEFIATEHTAKNLMIAAVKRHQEPRAAAAAGQVRALAAFFGIRSQRLAGQLGFELAPLPQIRCSSRSYTSKNT